MAIDVSHAGSDDVERWDGLVARSPQGTPFHLYGFLEVLAEHSNARLHPLVGYKGQEPVGLFPGFELARGPVSTVFSPAPNWKVPYLGPALLNQGKPKRRKAERDHREFVSGSLEAFAAERAPRYVHVRTATGYDDVRPFLWEGYETTAGYTYLVDLTVGEADLLASFSGDARQNIRNVEGADCTVREGGVEGIERIVTQLAARHAEQGEHYRVTPGFATDLYHRLPEGTVRPYVCTVDGEFVGGMIALELGDTVYRWQGGAKTDVGLSVNDYIDWTVMREAAERGLARYDMVGANNERLTHYKAKFDPDLALYLKVQAGTRTMNLVSSLYRRLR